MIEQFHFLRPIWLLALLPLLALLWHGFNHRRLSRSWQSVVDAKLLPHLLGDHRKGRSSGLWSILGIAASLAILALAGPVWDKLPQPIFRQQSALVIALDLSRSMDAGDIRPSRLTRARLKIADILNLRDEGQTALVAYAADAFVVTPLTEDAATINALLPALSTGLMPSQGSNAANALTQSFALFDNAGITRGDILLLSDGFDDRELAAMQVLMQENSQYRVSVLGVGTEQGGPIPVANSGFLKDQQGAIVVARLRQESLRKIAEAGGGGLQLISADATDINSLLNSMSSRFENDAVESDLQADVWRELGPWLVLMLLPLVAMLFRRGVLLVLPLLLLPMPPEANALGWDDLWKNQDQRGIEAFEQKEYEAASGLFNRPEWKATSAFRAGDYEQSLKDWEGLNSERAHYNRGNTLAKLEKYKEAIEAYSKALEMNPGHEDAAYNKKLIEDRMQKQQQQQGEQSDQQNQDPDQQQESEESSRRGDDQQNQAEQQSSSEQSESQQSDEQKEGEQQSAEQDEDSGSEQQQSALTEELANMEQQMSEQAAEQWLRKIPDDPGGLLRRKFLYQYRQRGDQSKAQNQW